MDLVKEATEVSSPYTRHLGIFNPHKHKVSATVIGCGAIGSFVAVGLAKMGVTEQTLFDFDTVDPENIAVQLHSKNGIGKNKAAVTANMISEFCPETPNITAHGRKWEGDKIRSEIVVAAVDSLQVRRDIWNSVKSDPSVKIVLDARIGGQFVKVYAVDPSHPADIKAYDETFPKNDMKGSELPCTERGIIDISLFASALLIRSARRWLVSREKETYLAFNVAGEFKSIVR